MASKIDEFVKSIHKFRWWCVPEKESNSRVIAQVTDEGNIEIKSAIIGKHEAAEMAKWLLEMTHDPDVAQSILMEDAFRKQKRAEAVKQK